jgi:hypothetical protein
MNECARVWPVCPRPESDESNRSLWSHGKLKSDREFLAPDRYRDLKVAREPVLRSTLLGC